MNGASSQSLDSMVTKYSRLIRAAVGRVAGPMSASVADDVEQEVLVALWKAMPGEQTPANPSSYLYRAAVRETVRVLKRVSRRPETAIDVDRHDPGPKPDRLAESKELGMAIGKALENLIPDRRRAVQAHLMGFDVRETMAMQGWSYNRARNLIARGMADLRRELESRGIHG